MGVREKVGVFVYQPGKSQGSFDLLIGSGVEQGARGVGAP